MWVQILVSIAISALAYVLTPKPKVPGPTAGRLDIPSTQLGAPIKVVFGEVWVEDAAISYYGNQATTPIKAEGGK